MVIKKEILDVINVMNRNPKERSKGCLGKGAHRRSKNG